jgi:DNA repair exonuclease SbcCD ATPase subunit
MYSDGEEMKVQLSIFQGLSQMIENQCDRVVNIRCFDEPNNSLSDKGKAINFDFFTKIAEQGKVVFCVDHDALFKNRFDQVITVIRENKKSYIYDE